MCQILSLFPNKKSSIALTIWMGPRLVLLRPILEVSIPLTPFPTTARPHLPSEAMIKQEKNTPGFSPMKVEPSFVLTLWFSFLLSIYSGKK